MTKTTAKPAAEESWNGEEPFSDNAVGAAKPARKRKKSTEAEIVLPEHDEEFLPVPPEEELGEMIDGSEDDITALEEEHENAPLVSDVGDEESFPVEDEDMSETTRKEDGSMADKKAEKTKVEYIRDEIKAMRAKGNEKIRPRDIIANLTKKGVKVTAPQVSVTLRDFDKAEKPAKAAKPAATVKAGKLAAAAEKAERSRATAKVAQPPVSGAAMTASVEELSAVSGFVTDMGGVSRARAMLDAYAAYAAAVSRT